MLRFIWDKVRKVFPISLLLAALGIVFYAMMKRAGEDVAALVGLFDIGVAVLLICMMVFFALRDALRWRKDFTLSEAMDEYRDAEPIGNGVRIGPERIFFNNSAYEYSAIRTLYAKLEYMPHLNGKTTRHYSLFAIRTDGKCTRTVVINEKNADTKAQAEAQFRRVMEIVSEKNPQVKLYDPTF